MENGLRRLELYPARKSALSQTGRLSPSRRSASIASFGATENKRDYAADIRLSSGPESLRKGNRAASQPAELSSDEGNPVRLRHATFTLGLRA